MWGVKREGAKRAGADYRGVAAASIVALFVVGLPTWSIAEPTDSAPVSIESQLAALRAESAAQKEQLQAQQNRIEQLTMMVQADSASMRKPRLVNASDAGNNNPGRVRVIGDTPDAAPNDSAPQSGAPEDRPRSQRAADQLLVQAGGVLLPPWVLQVEPSVDETHVSNPRVNIFGYTIFNAINIGTIRVDDLSQDVVNSNLTLRAGLPFRTQVDLRVPFTAAFVRQTKGIGTGNISEVNTQGTHLGDIQATLSWQPIVERDAMPAVVLRTRVTVPTGESVFQIPETFPVPANGAETQLLRAPTGSGYYSIEPGLTLVWRSDPLVLFVGGSYALHLATPDYIVPLFNPGATGTVPKVTQVNHGIVSVGNTAQFNAGLNFTVNERASINFSFVDIFQDYSRVRGPTTRYTKLLGTTVNDARLGIGASFGLTDRVALVVNAGMGLTDQSPGYTFAVSLPITFR